MAKRLFQQFKLYRGAYFTIHLLEPHETSHLTQPGWAGKRQHNMENLDPGWSTIQVLSSLDVVNFSDWMSTDIIQRRKNGGFLFI